MVKFTDPTFKHIRAIAGNLRESDTEEIAASCGLDPLQALALSVEVSVACWVILDSSGTPIAIFGCAPCVGPACVGSVWMLGTPAMDQNGIAILRNSLPYIEKMHKHFPVLHNFIDLRNLKSQKWLEWCGFKVIDIDMSYGVGGLPFLHFIRHQA